MSVQPSGAGASPAIGTRAQVAVLNELSGRLQVGMRVELIPTRSIGPDLIEAQLRPLMGPATWANGVRVQLTAALPANTLQAVGEGAATGTPPALRAEVVATGSTLILKILAPADRSASTPASNPAPAAGSREWLGQQFRQHWPESRPLAATLENITTRLAKEIDADPVATLKTLTPLPTSNPSETTSPIRIRHAVATLIDQLASASELTDPERLSTAVSRSGLWMEALLAQAAMDPARSSELKLDLKAQLLTLAQQIRLQGTKSSGAPSGDRPLPERRPDSNLPQSGLPSSQTASPARPLPGPASSATVTQHSVTPHQTRAALEITRPEQQVPTKPGAGSTDKAANPVDRLSEQPSPKSIPVDQDTTLPATSSQTTRATSVMLLPATSDESKPPPQTEPENLRTNTLARDVEGMIKQVVTKQLQSLDNPGSQTQWLLELPFRTPTGLQALEADIRRQQTREDDEHETWSMRLRLDLPKLGPLNILLTLRDERLNASLQAGNPEGAEQIKRHLGDLRARLEAREIEVASLHAGHRPLERPTPPFDDPLVRTQA